MKIKSKIGDGMFIGLVVFAILTLAMYVVWVITSVWWPAITLSAIMLVVIAPIYFATYYEITRTELRIYCGLVGKTIPYRSIISMTDAESIAPAMCLSSRRILIRYMENEEIKSAFVSPANREQFRDLMNAEISKSTEIYRDVPKTTLDKAVEKARKSQIPMSRPEERAARIANEEQLAQDKKNVNQELKRLDDVIEENATHASGEAPYAQRKKAENKLLAKIRKLKDKKERTAKKDEAAKLKEQQAAEKAAKKQAKEQAKAPVPAKKTNEPETPEQHKQRLEAEKAKLKAAIEEAKKDQYVPPKRSAKTADDSAAKVDKPSETKAEEKQKETKKSEDKKAETEAKPVEKSTESTATKKTTKPKTKKAQLKKEKVEEAKKSTAVVKKGTKDKK